MAAVAAAAAARGLVALALMEWMAQGALDGPAWAPCGAMAALMQLLLWTKQQGQVAMAAATAAAAAP